MPCNGLFFVWTKHQWLNVNKELVDLIFDNGFDRPWILVFSSCCYSVKVWLNPLRPNDILFVKIWPASRRYLMLYWFFENVMLFPITGTSGLIHVGGGWTRIHPSLFWCSSDRLWLMNCYYCVQETRGGDSQEHLKYITCDWLVSFLWLIRML